MKDSKEPRQRKSNFKQERKSKIYSIYIFSTPTHNSELTETPKSGHQKHTEKQTLEDETLQESPQKRKSLSVNSKDQGSEEERLSETSPGKQEPLTQSETVEASEDSESQEDTQIQ